VAAVTGIVLAAAGGFGGYELVSNRPVTVKAEGLSVKVPREWKQKAVNKVPPALLISTDTANWRTNNTVAGVYLGKQNTATVPTTAPTVAGCEPTPSQSDAVNAEQATFRYTCSNSTTLIQRFAKLSGTQSLWIQVRGSDLDEVQQVLDSASTY
jgi:hypothetical protein